MMIAIVKTEHEKRKESSKNASDCAKSFEPKGVQYFKDKSFEIHELGPKFIFGFAFLLHLRTFQKMFIKIILQTL